jgi:hypothetical protein
VRKWKRTSVGWLVAATLLVNGCAISRVQIGSPLQADPAESIKPEFTNMATVLERFGAPNRVLRHGQGDVFIYHFKRRHTDTFTLEEPVITNLEIFTYSTVKEKEDRLVVLFDRKGVVESYGYLQGTAELD